jgi:hypothetical protein
MVLFPGLIVLDLNRICVTARLATGQSVDAVGGRNDTGIVVDAFRGAACTNSLTPPAQTPPLILDQSGDPAPSTTPRRVDDAFHSMAGDLDNPPSLV